MGPSTAFRGYFVAEGTPAGPSTALGFGEPRKNAYLSTGIETDVIMKNFFLVSTNHLKDRLWFREDEDFRVAMNYVAIVAYLTGCSVFSFILMSNHVHFVLMCGREEAEVFINKFKRLYAAYYQKKYGVYELLRRNGVDIREVHAEDESLERAIAYVMMNCVAANICLEPSGYPWGTGNVFFNGNPSSGSRLGDLSGRAQLRILKSNVKLPQDYLLASAGYILPRSYVNTRGVEALFRTPKRLGYFLRTSSKAKLRLEKDAMPSFRDQILHSACEDLCHSLFRVHHPSELSEEQMAELLRQLKRRFSSDLNQLCRVIGITYTDAARMIDNY